MGKNIIKDFKKYLDTEDAYIQFLLTNIKEDILEIMEKKDINKKDLAKLTGLKEQNVSRFFQNEHNATLKTVGKIAYALGKKGLMTFIDKDIDSVRFRQHIEKFHKFSNTTITYNHYTPKNQSLLDNSHPSSNFKPQKKWNIQEPYNSNPRVA